MALEPHETTSLLRAAARATADAFDSLALAAKCADEAGSEFVNDANLLRNWADRLVDDLNTERKSIEDAHSNVRWL